MTRNSHRHRRAATSGPRVRQVIEQLESRTLLTSIVSASLDYAHAPTAFHVVFDTPVANLFPGDLSTRVSPFDLDNITTDQQILNTKLSADPANPNALFITAPASAHSSIASIPGVLPDGYYRLSAAWLDIPGLSPDWHYDDFVLAGDANRDGVVDSGDFNAVIQHFGTAASNGDWAAGNFNFDSIININDFNIVALNFGNVLTPPPVGPNHFSLSWSGASQFIINWDADSVTGETGWRIERSLDGHTFDTYFNDSTDVTGIGTFIDDYSNLPEGQRVYYRVRAYGNGQDTAYTPKHYSITTLKNPTDVTATGISDTQIRLNWTNNSSATVDGYEIIFPYGVSDPIYVPGNATSAVISELSPNSPYSFYLLEESSVAYSDCIQTPSAMTLPAAPDNPTATATDPTHVTLNWAYVVSIYGLAAASSFIVQRTNTATGEVASFTTGGNARTFTDATAADGTSYTYIVKTVIDGDVSLASTAAAVITPLAAPTVDSNSVVPSGTGVTVRWTNHASAASGFTVTLTHGTDTPTVHTLSATATNDSFTGLTTYTDYTISVAAIGGSGGGSSGGGNGGSGGGNGGNGSGGSNSGGSSAPTLVPFNSGGLDQTSTWVTDYWRGAPVGAATSFPGVTADEAFDVQDEILGDRIETVTLDQLPRHTYSQVTVHLRPDYPYAYDGTADSTITLKINGQAMHTWHWFDLQDADHDNIFWDWGGDAYDGTPDDSGVQAHAGKGLTVSLEGENFPQNGNDFAWQIDYLKVSTYFPQVGLSGQGTSLEGVDYGGDSSNSAPTTSGGYFTVSRSGTPATWGQPLSVTMKPETGSREDGIAIPGQDFQGIDSVTIPAGQQSVDVPVKTLHNDTYDTLNAYESVVKNNNYLLAAANTTAPATSTTTRSVQVKSAILDYLSVANATQNGVDTAHYPTAWATIKGAGVVNIDAHLKGGLTAASWPNGVIPDGVINWTNGEQVPNGTKLQRQQTKAQSDHKKITAATHGVSKSVDVWVMWSTVKPQVKGDAPAGAVDFKVILDPQTHVHEPAVTQKLGRFDFIDWDGGTRTAGKMAATVKLEPAGVGKVVTSGWDIKRDKFVRGGAANQHDVDWHSDDAFEQDETHLPDASDQLYSIDAPEGEAYQGVVEKSINFIEYLNWNGGLASDKSGLWSFHFKITTNGHDAPIIDFSNVELGNLTLAD